jgi:uncharacterized protein YbjT (DUF2867 family)
VKNLVKLSSMDARQKVGTGLWHARGESAIRATGISFTFVQPAGFMSNALGWVPSVKAEGVVSAPTGDGRIAFIHPDDIAAVAVEALTKREYERESLPITGPEALSYGEMTAKIGAAVGKPLRFHPISEEQERLQMIESGWRPEIVDAHVSIYRAIREGRLAIVTDNVDRVIRQTPISVPQPALGLSMTIDSPPSFCFTGCMVLSMTPWPKRIVSPGICSLQSCNRPALERSDCHPGFERRKIG